MPTLFCIDLGALANEAAATHRSVDLDCADAEQICCVSLAADPLRSPCPPWLVHLHLVEVTDPCRATSGGPLRSPSGHLDVVEHAVARRRVVGEDAEPEVAQAHVDDAGGGDVGRVSAAAGTDRQCAAGQQHDEDEAFTTPARGGR